MSLVPDLERVALAFFDEAPMVIRSDVFIAAPRADVFAAIAGDPAGWGEWFPGFTSDGRWETPPPHGVGSVRAVRAFRTDYRETILAWDADKRWAFRVDRTSAPMFSAFAEDYRLTDEGDGTRLAWTVAYRPRLAMRLAAPVAPRAFQRIARRVASGLTRVAGKG
jgi:hypothetical protein